MNRVSELSKITYRKMKKKNYLRKNKSDCSTCNKSVINGWNNR